MLEYNTVDSYLIYNLGKDYQQSVPVREYMDSLNRVACLNKEISLFSNKITSQDIVLHWKIECCLVYLHNPIFYFLLGILILKDPYEIYSEVLCIQLLLVAFWPKL